MKQILKTAFLTVGVALLVNATGQASVSAPTAANCPATDKVKAAIQDQVKTSASGKVDVSGFPTGTYALNNTYSDRIRIDTPTIITVSGVYTCKYYILSAGAFGSIRSGATLGAIQIPLGAGNM
jgi:hypothetical protein